MVKRFTDTTKWTDDEWFMELDPIMKCLWNYMCDMCDCCGVWKVNFKQASFSIGAIVDRQSALKAMEPKVTFLTNEKWFIASFIKIQYPGMLTLSNSAHRGVIKKLNFHDIETRPYLAPIKALDSSLVGAKDKDKDKDKDSYVLSINAEKNLSENESQDFRNSKEVTTDKLIQLYNDTLAGKGKISHCHGLSGKNIQDFITTTAYSNFQKIKTWEEIFQKVSDSDFLTGRQKASSFVASLNWLIEHDNALKVLNGQYAKSGDSGQTDAFLDGIKLEA